MSKQLWNERFENEGHLWGDEPSLTAQLLLGKLEPKSTICEIGLGYGRDIIAMAKAGHIVHGVEEASAMLSEATKQLKALGIDQPENLLCAEFTEAALPEEKFDAVYSHRMLHLLTKDEQVAAFADQAARILKPGGLLYIGARDVRDFNEKQMEMVTDNTAEYTIEGRKGHLVRFWHEARYRGVFEEAFVMTGFAKGDEPESQSNPSVMCHFTIMMAQKPEATTAM